MPPLSRSKALQRLRVIADERQAHDDEERRLVAMLRSYPSNPVDWKTIGWALGLSPQGAQQRHGRSK